MSKQASKLRSWPDSSQRFHSDLFCWPPSPIAGALIPQYDTRDAEEHAAIAAILAELPVDHPAHLAYRDHEDTRRLTHLADRQDLAERLTLAFLDGYNRLLRRAGRHFRP